MGRLTNEEDRRGHSRSSSDENKAVMSPVSRMARISSTSGMLDLSGGTRQNIFTKMYFPFFASKPKGEQPSNNCNVLSTSQECQYSVAAAEIVKSDNIYTVLASIKDAALIMAALY